MRRQFTAEQKAAVALAALKGDKTINQIASAFAYFSSEAFNNFTLCRLSQ